MTSSLLKQHFTKVINNINDKEFLEAVFTIVSKKADSGDLILTQEMKNELDKRKERHEKGFSKSYSWQNVKKAALNAR